jgi:hypothetical protein
MSNTRRQFLGSLARGLLLPIGGGALTLADPAKAGNLQVTRGDLPLSPDALLLRSLKRELRHIQIRSNQDDTYSFIDSERDWHGIMQGQIHPLQARMLSRAAATWTDCVELAEMAWWGVAHRRSLAACVKQGQDWRPPIDSGRRDPRDALVEAVLSLGGGEKFSNHPEEDEAKLSPGR